ncbi:MAG: hypothetical protein GMKNLPBB_00431 [Myxococcota bacterium]|nr:hypothetical protein [Myxococcota bacterium]
MKNRFTIRRLRRGAHNGFALMLAMGVSLILAGIAMASLSIARLEHAMAAAERDTGLLETTARSCASQLVDLLRVFGTNAETNKYIPNTLMDPSIIRNHPLIGSCYAVNSNCAPGSPDLNSDGVAETYCCCRTGPAFDSNFTLIAFDHTDPNISNTQIIERGPQIIGHDLTIPNIPIRGDDRLTYSRHQITITAAVRTAVREFQLGVDSGPLPKKGSTGTSYTDE